jgi:hypothetical protein
MLAHHRLEFPDHLRLPAQREIGLHPALERHQPQLRKPRDLALRK